jgi:hypothetical protein
MENLELINVRGKNLLAHSMWVGGQEFLIIAIPGDRQDAAPDPYPQQQEIKIALGLRIKNKKSGQEFKILSKPTEYYKQVELQDIHHMQLPLHLTEDEIRQNFWFVG